MGTRDFNRIQEYTCRSYEIEEYLNTRSSDTELRTYNVVKYIVLHRYIYPVDVWTCLERVSFDVMDRLLQILQLIVSMNKDMFNTVDYDTSSRVIYYSTIYWLTSRCDIDVTDYIRVVSMLAFVMGYSMESHLDSIERGIRLANSYNGSYGSWWVFRDCKSSLK